MNHPFESLQRFRHLNKNATLDIYVWNIIEVNPNDVEIRVCYINKFTDKVVSPKRGGYLENVIIKNDDYGLWYPIDDDFTRN